MGLLSKIASWFSGEELRPVGNIFDYLIRKGLQVGNEIDIIGVQKTAFGQFRREYVGQIDEINRDNIEINGFVRINYLHKGTNIPVLVTSEEIKENFRLGVEETFYERV